MRERSEIKISSYFRGHFPAHLFPNISVRVACDRANVSLQMLVIGVVNQTPAFQGGCPPCLATTLTQLLSLTSQYTLLSTEQCQHIETHVTFKSTSKTTRFQKSIKCNVIKMLMVTLLMSHALACVHPSV